MYHPQDPRSAYQQQWMSGMMNLQRNPYLTGLGMCPVERARNLAWGSGVPLSVILEAAPSIQKKGARIFQISRHKDGKVEVWVELPTIIPRVARTNTTA